jgi:hypothetical protein
VIAMTFDPNKGAFKRWQSRQRELHWLETSLLQAARDAAQDHGESCGSELTAQAQALREEVDRLFPLAMQDLEQCVRKLKDKRPRLRKH